MVTKTERYTEAVGRRKTSTARARLTPAKQTAVTVNTKSLEDYFPTEALRSFVLAPFSLEDAPTGTFSISVMVKGGGIVSQSQAIRHAISRALIKLSAELRPELKKAGFLTRDPRMKERRKFGLKKARRAPQWSKR
jgi:small subunit ribosomal protein S9